MKIIIGLGLGLGLDVDADVCKIYIPTSVSYNSKLFAFRSTFRLHLDYISVTRYMYLNVSCQWTDNSLSYYKTVTTTTHFLKLLRFSVNTFAFRNNCTVCHRHQEAVVLKREDKESTTMPFPMKTAKHVCYSTGKWQHGYWIWWIKYLADRKWDKNWLAGITATEVDVTGLQSRLVS